MQSQSVPESANLKVMRRQRFVDPKVQGALVVRAVVYWVVCLTTIMLMLLCWRIVTGPARPFHAHFDDMWFFYGPPAVASLLLLPLVIVDVIRVSSRFAGPMLRLRRSMRSLARGEHVEPIKFRDGDFWHEFAEEFNQVLARVQGLESNSTEEAGPAEAADEVVMAGQA